MSSEPIIQGGGVILGILSRDGAGALTDADEIVAEVRDPAGVLVTYLLSLDEITQTATGTYELEIVAVLASTAKDVGYRVHVETTVGAHHGATQNGTNGFAVTAKNTA